MLPPTFLRAKRIHAFSLVEMLVVTAVVLVLLGLSLSVVSSLQEKGKSVKCLQNLKSVGASLFAYVADHQQMVPPRNLGLYRDPADPSLPPPLERPWVNRLIIQGYADNPDIFYCPSFTPYNNRLSPTPLPHLNRIRTYGIRTWTAPGTIGWGTGIPSQEEHKSLALIDEPGDFFLVVDTVWTHPNYKSQGYGINPGMGAEQLIHLRHSGQANALFADGHVASKPESYFAELHLPNRQQRYSGGRSEVFGTTSKMEF